MRRWLWALEHDLEDGEGEGPPVLYMLYGNTAEHFSEHRQWIDELVKG